MDAIIFRSLLKVDEGDLSIGGPFRRAEAGAKRFDRAICSNNRSQPSTVLRVRIIDSFLIQEADNCAVVKKVSSTEQMEGAFAEGGIHHDGVVVGDAVVGQPIVSDDG